MTSYVAEGLALARVIWTDEHDNSARLDIERCVVVHSYALDRSRKHHSVSPHSCQHPSDKSRLLHPGPKTRLSPYFTTHTPSFPQDLARVFHPLAAGHRLRCRGALPRQRRPPVARRPVWNLAQSVARSCEQCKHLDLTGGTLGSPLPSTANALYAAIRAGGRHASFRREGPHLQDHPSESENGIRGRPSQRRRWLWVGRIRISRSVTGHRSSVVILDTERRIICLRFRCAGREAGGNPCPCSW
jgi:hypothetical protein